MDTYRLHGLQVDLEAVAAASKESAKGSPEKARLTLCRTRIEQVLAAIKRGDAKGMAEGEFRQPPETAIRTIAAKADPKAKLTLAALLGIASVEAYRRR